MKEQFIRYSNRKTYSTLQKKYVNLDYLLQKVKDSEEFTVTEKDTGNDITSKVVRQAVATSTLSVEQIRAALCAK
jgi:polyhydroxyalkanoate synthesis regulator protein